MEPAENQFMSSCRTWYMNSTVIQARRGTLCDASVAKRWKLRR